MRPLLLFFIVAVVAFVAYRVFTAVAESRQVFDRKTVIPCSWNPLWSSDNKPLSNSLTRELQGLGLEFAAGLGAEADPTGMAFQDKGSDEYWIVTYFPDEKKVHAFVWIVGVSSSGGGEYEKRFSAIKQAIGRFVARNPQPPIR